MSTVRLNVRATQLELVSAGHNKFYRSFAVPSFMVGGRDVDGSVFNQWGRRGAKGQWQRLSNGWDSHGIQQETVWSKEHKGYQKVVALGFTLEIASARLEGLVPAQMGEVLKPALVEGFETKWCKNVAKANPASRDKGEGWALIWEAETTMAARAPARALEDLIGEVLYEDTDPHIGVVRQVRRIPMAERGRIAAVFSIYGDWSQYQVQTLPGEEDDNAAVMEMALRLYEPGADGELSTFAGAVGVARTLVH